MASANSFSDLDKMDTNNSNPIENSDKSLAICNEETVAKPNTDLEISDLPESNRKKVEKPSSQKDKVEDKIKTSLITISHKNKDQSSMVRKRIQYHFKASNKNDLESQSKSPSISSQSKDKTGNCQPHK